MKVVVNNVNVEALLDSGASISCLSQKFYHSCPMRNNSKLNPSSVSSIQGVSGQLLQVVGQVTIPVVANRLKLLHTFQVIKDLPKSVILVVDFLSEHKASINWANNT